MKLRWVFVIWSIGLVQQCSGSVADDKWFWPLGTWKALLPSRRDEAWISTPIMPMLRWTATCPLQSLRWVNRFLYVQDIDEQIDCDTSWHLDVIVKELPGFVDVYFSKEWNCIENESKLFETLLSTLAVLHSDKGHFRQGRLRYTSKIDFDVMQEVYQENMKFLKVHVVIQGPLDLLPAPQKPYWEALKAVELPSLEDPICSTVIGAYLRWRTAALGISEWNHLYLIQVSERKDKYLIQCDWDHICLCPTDQWKISISVV